MQQDISQSIIHFHKLAKTLLEKKATNEDVIETLVQEGITPDYAELIVGNVRNDMHKRKEFWRHIILGCLIMTAVPIEKGLAFLFSNNVIAPGVYLYYVIWSIFIIGITLIARAFILYWK